MEVENHSEHIIKTSGSPKVSPVIVPTNSKSKLFLILGLIVALVAGLAYYLSEQNHNTQTSQLNNIPLNTQQSSKCEEQGGNLFSTKQSQEDGWCELSLPLIGYSYTGYTMRYPDSWNVRIAGAEGMNLYFNKGVYTGNAQELFIGITRTKLPLEQADKSTYSFEQSAASLLVDPTEQVVSKTIENVGDKQVLHLVTEQDSHPIHRYFLLHQESEDATVYMFKTSSDNEVFLSDIKQMISSMKFAK